MFEIIHPTPEEMEQFWGSNNGDGSKPKEPTEIEILTTKVDTLTKLIIPMSMGSVEPPKTPETPPDELPPLPPLNSLPPLPDIMGMMADSEPPEITS